MSLRPATTPHQYGGSVRTDTPSTEPVTAAQLQTHLRVTDTILTDAAALQLIAEARAIIEEITGIAMIIAEWQLTLDDWPRGHDVWWDGVRQGATTSLLGAANGIIELPRYPLDSINSVTVYASDGTSTAITVATVFVVDTSQTPGRLTLASGQVWPSIGQPINAVEISYQAGYGETAADVPAPLYRAVLQCAAYLYSHRGDGCDAASAYKASGAASLAGIFDVKRI